MLFLRALPLILGGLAVIYLCTFYYLRDTYRDSLIDGTERIHPEIVETRVQAYAARMRRRLAWAVFVLPLSAIALAILFADLIWG